MTPTPPSQGFIHRRCRSIPFAFVVAILLAAPAHGALDPAKTPGQNFDLSRWKLQLPIYTPDDPDGLLSLHTSVDEVFNPALTTYTSKYFYTNSDGAMRFYAPTTGDTTSGSNNPRSELRELYTDSQKSWLVTYGTAVLDGSLKIYQTPAATGKVVIGQIHGDTDTDPTHFQNALAVLLYYQTGKIWAEINYSPSVNDRFKILTTTISSSLPSPLITYRIVMVPGAMIITLNGNSQTAIVDQSAATGWQNAQVYFKAGDYVQISTPVGQPANDGGSTAFYSLQITHVNSSLAVSTTTLPSAAASSVYSQALQITGASGTVTWSLPSAVIGQTDGTSSAAGALPPGLSLSSAGVISGTPSSSGIGKTYSNIVVQATDATGAIAVKTLSLSVTAAKTPAAVTLANLSATYDGGAKSVTATTNPAGLAVTFTYDSSSTPPTAAGSYSVVGTINDSTYQGSASGTLVIAKATASLSLGSLTANYDGNTHPVTCATGPPGLTVNLTYDGSATPPTNPGSYAVVASVSDANYQGSANGTLVIAKAAALATLDGLSATYNGTPRSVTVSTSPSGLATSTTYNGSVNAPTVPGSYAVTATINDPYYQGSATGTLVIAKAAAVVTLSDLAATYDGSSKPVAVTTSPAGLGLTLTYNGVAMAPTEAGSYAVAATIQDDNFQGSATSTLVIGKETVTVNLGALSTVYDGNPHPVPASTIPSGLAVTVTYNGSTTAPVDAGGYSVNAAVNDTNYAGTATGTLEIAKAANVITFNPIAGVTVLNEPFLVSASTSSQLTPVFSIVGGPATLTGTTVTVTGSGLVTIRASQAGNQNYAAAADVDREFTVGKANQVISFTVSPVFKYGDAPVPVGATADSTLPVSISVLSGPASVANGLVTLTGAGTVVLRAGQPGDATFSAAPDVDRSITVAKVPLTITADNQSRLFGDANPTLTVSYTGFVNDDTVAAITPPTASTTASASSPPGSYPVSLAGGSAANYTLTLVNGSLTITPRNYAGTYFGTSPSGGHWALYVHQDGTATFLAYLPGRQSAILVNLTVGTDGTFSVAGTEFKPADTLRRSQSLATGESPLPRTASAADDYTLSGSIAPVGTVTGALTGLGETLAGSADAGSTQTPAMYSASALGTASGSTYAIVGPSGQTLVVTLSPTSADGAIGTVNSSGQLTATTAGNATLTLTLNVSAQTLAASIIPQGSSTAITYAGLASTVTPVARVVNLSVRTPAGTGSQTLIIGLVVTGTGSKTLLVRGIGPTLSIQGVASPLADPTMRLLNEAGAVLDTDNDWGGSATLSQQFSALGAFALPSDSKDAALYRTIPTGVYSVHVYPNDTGTGVVLAELYDADDDSNPATVANISARTQVGTGENILIAGFVISGNSPKTLLIRGVGPTLGMKGVSGALADPQLYLFDSTSFIASNDNWGGTTALKNAFAVTGAGALASDTSKDAALLVTLLPGVYSAQVSGVGGTSGVGLVEIFLVP